MDILDILLLAPPFTFAVVAPTPEPTPQQQVVQSSGGGAGGSTGGYHDSVRKVIREYEIKVEDTEIIEFAIMLTRVL